MNDKVKYSLLIDRYLNGEMDDAGNVNQRLGYLPKDAPRQLGQYLATLRRPEGKRRLEGTLSLLRSQSVSQVPRGDEGG